MELLTNALFVAQQNKIMLDTRCYACAQNILTEEDMMGKLAEKVYQGNGIFKCSWCGDILDLSKDTYKIKISRFYDCYGELETKILNFDLKLKGDGKDIFESDLYEMNIFDYIPFGKYNLEILWYYFQCGGYEFPNEYDIKMELLSKKEIIGE